GPALGLAEIIDAGPDELAGNVWIVFACRAIACAPPLIAGVVLGIAWGVEVDLMQVRLAAEQHLVGMLLVIAGVEARLIIHADHVHVAGDLSERRVALSAIVAHRVQRGSDGTRRIEVVHDVFDRLVQERSRSEEHTSELQSRENLVCRLLLEKKKKKKDPRQTSMNKTTEEDASARA